MLSKTIASLRSVRISATGRVSQRSRRNSVAASVAAPSTRPLVKVALRNQARQGLFSYRSTHIQLKRNYCTSEEPEEEAIEKTTYLRAYEAYCDLKTDEALAALDEMDAQDPQYSLGLGLRGRIHTLKGEYNQAMHAFEKSLEVNDANALTYYYKATLHEIMKQPEEAMQCLMDCIDVDSEFSLARVDLAGLLVGRGDFQTAIEHCNYCLHSQPDMDQALYWKARALYKLGRLVDAKKIVADYEKYADTYAVKLAALAAEIELDLDQVDKAKQLFLNGLKENKDQFPDEALCKLAGIHVQEGNPGEAYTLLKKRVDEEESSQNLQSEVGHLLHRSFALVRYVVGDIPGAIESYERSLELDPKQLEVHYEMARCLIELMRHDLAVIAIERAEQVFPLDVSLKKLKIVALVDSGRSQEALETLEALETEEPGQVDHLAPWRCIALHSVGRSGECEELFQQIKGNNYDPFGTINLSRVAALHGQGELAKTILLRLLSVPNMPPTVLGLAARVAEWALGDLKLSSQILTHLVKQHPTHALYVSQLARARQLLGNLDFALVVWGHVTKIVPGDARAWVSIGDIYTQKQKFLEALSQFKRAQECEGPPNFIQEAITKEAMTLLLLQRWAQAVEVFDLAINGKQYTDLALRVYGAVLAGECDRLFGISMPEHFVDLEQAIQLLKSALHDNVENKLDQAETLTTLARALAKAGRHREALQYLTRAKSEFPDSPDLDVTQKIIMSSP